MCLAKHSITDKDSRFFVTLTNVFLGFLAIIDFPFEFRCFQWGSYSEVLTADACVKMSVNTMNTALANKSRPETTLDFDMSMLCLKLSILSPVFFTNRVQFVLGELEAVGRTPAWVSPENRRAERGKKTDRALAPRSAYTFEPPQRSNLLGALKEKGGGITLVNEMQVEDLKKLHKVVFGKVTTNGYGLCSNTWRSHIPHFSARLKTAAIELSEPRSAYFLGVIPPRFF